MRHGLCNGTVSVHPSVCPVYQPLQQRPAGLLLWVRRRRHRSISARPAPDSNGAAAARCTAANACEQCHVYSRRRRLNTDLFYLHRVAKTAVWYPAAFYLSIFLIILLLLFLFAANNSTTVRGTVTTRFRCGGQVYSRLLFNTSSGFRLAKNIHIGWLRPSHSKIRFRRFWVMVCFMQLSLISRFFVIMC